MKVRRQKQRWGESTEPSRWQRLHQLSRSGLASTRSMTRPRQTGLRSQSSGVSRGLPASPGVSCFQRGEMSLTRPPPSGGGVAVVEEAQGHNQSSPCSKGEHLAVQGSAEGHRDYSLLSNLILRIYDPINCGETNTGEETWEPDA